MNSNQEPEKFSERFDKKYLTIFFLFLALSFASGALAVTMIGHRIWGVVLTFITLILLAFTVIFFKKAIKEGTFVEGMYLSFLALCKLFSLIFRPIVKLLTMLGFLGGRRAGGSDEHSFIFDFRGRGRKNKADKMPKWKNLTSNQQRVRYIFTKHMNHRIKKGFRFNKTYTPNELEKELNKLLKEDESVSLLFDSYRLARYENEERLEIEDDLVERLKELY